MSHDVSPIRRRVDMATILNVRLSEVLTVENPSVKTYFRQDQQPIGFGWRRMDYLYTVRWINPKPYSKLDLCDLYAEDTPAWSTQFFFIDSDGDRITYQDINDDEQDLEVTGLLPVANGTDPEALYAKLPTIAGVEVVQTFTNCTGEMDLTNPGALFMIEGHEQTLNRH